jgi:hypothetical protein
LANLFVRRTRSGRDQHPASPGERLIACRNSLLTGRHRPNLRNLLAGIEKRPEKVAAETRRMRHPLTPVLFDDEEPGPEQARISASPLRSNVPPQRKT